VQGDAWARCVSSHPQQFSKKKLLKWSFGWHRMAALASLGLGLTTIVLFLYLLLIPWTRGVQLNVRYCVLSLSLVTPGPTLPPQTRACEADPNLTPHSTGHGVTPQSSRP
jgi:hypothetical protein